MAYDWRAQAESMRAAGLPEAFVETIESGWWTTCLEVVPPPERSRGRYHVYREAMPSGFAADGVGWAEAPEQEDDGLPVVSMFGTELFPPRLWVYSNFHCNLACDYCVVASSPTARKREISRERFEALVDEAVDEGFTELYVTGGEPFVHPDMVEMAEYASERLETVVLTNAMLFTGRRARGAGAPGGPPAAHPAELGRRRAPGDARPLARRGLVAEGDGRHRLRARAGPAAAGGDDRDARQPRGGGGAGRAARRRSAWRTSRCGRWCSAASPTEGDGGLRGA